MIIIGAGRVGTSLKKRSEAAEIPVDLVTRTTGDSVLEGPQGDPIVVATRNDDLLDVIERVPDYRLGDLVFVQNGVFRGLLRNNHLSNCTRGLIYFAATARDGDIDPGTISWFTGPHGLTMARWFSLMDLQARHVDWPRFSYYEFEKLAWLCIFGVLCDAHDCTVDEALDHTNDFDALLAEMRHFGRAEYNVDAPLDYVGDRLRDYSRSIAGYRASVKEWDWRNGAVLRAMVDHGERRMPATQRLLKAGGHADKLSGLA